MKANVDNVKIMQDVKGYHIMMEFSRLPVESFDTYEQANDFKKGYLEDCSENKYQKQGRMLRMFVEADLKNGIELRKVISLDSNVA